MKKGILALLYSNKTLDIWKILLSRSSSLFIYGCRWLTQANHNAYYKICFTIVTQENDKKGTKGLEIKVCLPRDGSRLSQGSWIDWEKVHLYLHQFFSSYWLDTNWGDGFCLWTYSNSQGIFSLSERWRCNHLGFTARSNVSFSSRHLIPFLKRGHLNKLLWRNYIKLQIKMNSIFLKV